MSLERKDLPGAIAQSIFAGAIAFGKGKSCCIKQQVYAMIVCADGKVVFGGNFMNNSIDVCPREEQNMKSGEGYHLCHEVCAQEHHAESDAIAKAKEAGIDIVGSDLFLIGHTYCCDSCINKMTEAGIHSCQIIGNNDQKGKFYSFIKEES